MKNLIRILLFIIISCGKKQSLALKENISHTMINRDTAISYSNIKDSIIQAETNDTTGLIKTSRVDLYAIKIRNIESLVALSIHPEEGIRFSPYSYINVETDRKISGDELWEEWNSNKKYRWGVFDGSGEPIVMTCKEYFDRFVYHVDFYNLATASLNKCQGSSNSGNNIKEVYKGLDFVDYRFPGSDPKLEGMDYEGLRLVYKKYNGAYKLVGVIHDEWTI